MKEYIVGLLNGILVPFIFCYFILQKYIAGTTLCFVVVSSIFIVFDVLPKIQLRKEAKEIENIINDARNKINKEFQGEDLS